MKPTVVRTTAVANRMLTKNKEQFQYIILDSNLGNTDGFAIACRVCQKFKNAGTPHDHHDVVLRVNCPHVEIFNG